MRRTRPGSRRRSEIRNAFPQISKGMSAGAALLTVLLVATCVWSIFYLVLASLYVGDWLRERCGEDEARALPPVTLLRPIKPGVPELRTKLAQLAAAILPGDQLVLGAEMDS